MRIDRRFVLLAAVGGAMVSSAACHRGATRVAASTPTTTDSTADSTTKVSTIVELIPPTPRARVPRDAARFEIDAVDDSTARFKPREAAWVKPGMDAYIVDPMHRDALVARVRITSIWNETAIAVVTSQTTRVTSQQVVLMVPPPAPWRQRHRYVLGFFSGAVLGGAIGAVVSR